MSVNIPFTVASPILKTIEIAHESCWGELCGYTFDSSSGLTIGDTLQLYAFGKYSNGAKWDITTSVTWSSSDTTVAQISTTGLITAINKGTAQITATYGSITSSITITVSPPPLFISITSPANNSTIYRTETTVSGTITTQAQEAGVIVNGIVAQVYGNQFVANHVPLNNGNNIIVAKAIDSNGAAGEAQIIVTSTPVTNYITLSSTTESGTAPLEVTLKIDSTFPFITSYLSSYGPSAPYITPISNEEYKVLMTTEGIYYITANVTDAQNQTYTDTIAITVIDKVKLDALLKAKWEGMKRALSQGDVEGAVGYFVAVRKDRYREIFTAMGNTVNPILAAISEIKPYTIEDGIAQYDAIRVENGTPYFYPLTFTKDEDGIWKILGF